MKKNNNILYILLIIILLFAVFFNNYYFSGHDTVIHLTNIINYSYTINIHNIFGSFVYPNIGNNFGYGTGIFYPFIPEYIPALLYKATNNIFISMKLYYFLIVFISGIGMLLLCNKIYKNKYISLISSSLYICMPYFISDYLVRDASSETLIFMVLPYIYLGLLYLLDNNYKKFIYIFSLSYIIGMNSHLVMMVYITLFVLLFLLFNIKNVLNKTTFKYLIISGILILLGSSSVIVRMLEYHNLGYTVFSDGAMATYDSLMSSIINIKELIYEVLSNNIGVYINSVALILLILCIIFKFIYKIKYNNLFKYIITSMIILLIFMMCPYIWKIMPHFLYNIQFVWRLETLFVFFVSIYCVSCIKYIKFKILNIKKLTFILVSCSLIIGLLFVNNSASKIGMSTNKFYDNTIVLDGKKNIYLLILIIILIIIIIEVHLLLLDMVRVV